jgi:hypothetical protein
MNGTLCCHTYIACLVIKRRNRCFFRDKYITQIYRTNISHKYITQIYRTNISHKYIAQIYRTNISHKYIAQIYHTNISHKYIAQIYRTNISHKYITQIYHTNISHKYITQIQCGKNIKLVNPLNAELNPICHLLALLGSATIVVVSSLRVNMNLLNQ